LGNKFLSNIRECDAIGEVVRLFELGDIQHVEGSVHPLRDVQIINAELALADLETIEKRINNIEKDVRRGDKEAILEKEILQRCLQVVNDGKLISSVMNTFSDEEISILKKLGLLSTKPILYILNKSTGKKNVGETDLKFLELKKYIEETNSQFVIVDAKIEDDLKDFEGEEKESFREELGGVSGDDGSPEIILKKLKKAVTGSEPKEKTPGVINLLDLLERFGAEDKAKEFNAQIKTGDIKYSDLKTSLAHVVSDYFAEFRERKAKIMEDKNYIADVLSEGAKKARVVAGETLSEVKEKIGLL
jgi:ribosome-binding ATPase YchF (GTP1/OBG family)